jgi:putative SOS response-associated peptidase YedK
MINARSETVAAKPSFRVAFKKRRCLILADGYYEWTGEKGSKQPFFITLPDNQPFAFAGLWETWEPKDDPDKLYRSCTIITTDASESVRDIHHRIPAVLKPDTHADWIDPDNQNADTLQEILTSGIVTDFSHYEVSKRVNSVKNNGQEILKEFFSRSFGIKSELLHTMVSSLIRANLTVD